MNIVITLRGSLKKYFDGEEERAISVPDGCTCAQALESAGIRWREIRNFGFVAVNGQRVMIHDRLKEGDRLKAYSRISGG